MRKLLVLLFVGALLTHAADAPTARAENWFSDIGQIQSDLAAITGLPFKHPVPYAVMDRMELRKYLESRVKKSVKPEELRAQELVLKMLGLVPQDFDLTGSTVDLLTEQAAAFYDYHQKKLFILENNTGPEARLALAHELAHALADQNFHLDKYTKDGMGGDDASTARQAVMEGQASWLMTAYITRQKSGRSEVPESVIQLMKGAFENGGEDYPVFSKEPLYIRTSLVFPYADGLTFQDAVFHKYGADGFRRVFANAPVSTHQILHPEAYLDGNAPAEPMFPHPEELKGLRKLADGTLGELDFRVLLTQYLDKDRAEPAAAHLVGSVYRLLETKHDHRPVLVLQTAWDSPEAASAFLGLYRDVLKAKWKTMEIAEETPTSIAGHGDSGDFRLKVDQNRVTTMEGLQAH